MRERMNRHVRANVMGWSHTRCQVCLGVCVCVCVCPYAEGGSSVYKCSWLVSFPFFLSLSPEDSTAALKRREGGSEKMWDDGTGKTWWES